MENYENVTPNFLQGLKHATFSYINMNLKDEEISGSYIGFIMLIHDKKQLTQKEITKIFGCDKAYVNRIITKLLDLEYVKKENGQKNVKLSLTEKGLEMVNKVDSVFINWRRIVFSDIPTPDLEIFFKTLDKMQSNLNLAISKKEEKND